MESFRSDTWGFNKNGSRAVVEKPVEMVEFRDPKMVEFLCWHDSLIVSRKSDPAIKVHYSLFNKMQQVGTYMGVEPKIG